MHILVILALGLLAWAWFTGRLSGWTGRDAAALGAIVIGASFAMRGSFIPGAVLVAGGGYWIAKNLSRLRLGTGARTDDQQLEEARDLLGVMPWAKEREIRAAYRNRIAKSHPDVGGSAFDAARLAEARDLLIRDAAQRAQR